LFYAVTKVDWAISPFHPSLIDLKINQQSHAAMLYRQRPYLIARVPPRQAHAIRPR